MSKLNSATAGIQTLTIIIFLSFSYFTHAKWQIQIFFLKSVFWLIDLSGSTYDLWQGERGLPKFLFFLIGGEGVRGVGHFQNFGWNGWDVGSGPPFLADIISEQPIIQITSEGKENK